MWRPGGLWGRFLRVVVAPCTLLACLGAVLAPAWVPAAIPAFENAGLWPKYWKGLLGPLGPQMGSYDFVDAVGRVPVVGWGCALDMLYNRDGTNVPARHLSQ